MITRNPSVSKSRTGITHGNPNLYWRGECRCDECREAANEYKRKYRASAHGKRRDAAQKKAEMRALLRLRATYRTVYEVLLAEERENDPILKAPYTRIEEAS